MMLPGLTRTPAQPASIAANTYLGWKWMSAITGICECLAISGSASASSCDGQATRTMSQPAAVSSAICWSVVLTSDVRVVVIDCTDTGASPPTSTLPTLIWRVLRRGARTGGGSGGIPRLMLICPLTVEELDRVHDVGDDEQRTHRHQETGGHVGDRQQLGHIHITGVRPAGELGEAALDALPEGADDVAAVQRQQRDEVEQRQEQVQ